MANIVVIEYLDESGKPPFARWFLDLDTHASAKVVTALYRMELGVCAAEGKRNV
jgi:hypothetical protein